MPESHMTAFDLFLLGRKLMKLGQRAIPPSQLEGDIATAVRLVIADVAMHPRSSVSEITGRCGFPQSQVSMAVARLTELGAVVTAPDPADRRRTLVTAAKGAVTRGARHASASIDQTIAEAIGVHAQDRLSEVLAALELLGDLITPESRTLKSEPAGSL
jgi:DNA-binding MarR family transcriptional regulator